ncbi:MAG: apolipoprotein N-acyltransferase [Bacteroidia bacterium]
METLKEKLSLSYLAKNKPIVLVFLSAFLLIGAFPPSPLAFLSYIGFIPLFYLMEYRNKIFGYCYFLLLFWNIGVGYWLGMTALGVDPDERFGAALSGILANTLNPLLMYLPIWAYNAGRKRLIAKGLYEKFQFLYPFSFVCFWITFEWLHLNWDLSWSWLTLGHCMTFYPKAIQYLEITGIFGVSAYILILNVAFFLLLKFRNLYPEKIKMGIAAVGVFLILPYLSNLYLLNPNRAVFQVNGTLNVRLIQPNIDPFGKLSGSKREQIANFSDLIDDPGIDTIDMALLPETAIPTYVFPETMRENEWVKPLWALVDSHPRLSIVTGIFEIKNYPPASQNVPPSASKCREGFCMGHYDVFNAAAVMRKNKPVQTVEKGKLVPMVERMPFLQYLAPILGDFVVAVGGTMGGYGLPTEIHPLNVNDKAKLGSMICYESEYGDYVRELTQKGANFMSIITNDGWWQKSSGHIQHAYFTTLRAIENRREVVRSANTGISLFSDNQGNLHQLTEYWTRCKIDRKVKLYEAQTFYVTYGDYLAWICAILALGTMIWIRVKR